MVFMRDHEKFRPEPVFFNPIPAIGHPDLTISAPERSGTHSALPTYRSADAITAPARPHVPATETSATPEAHEEPPQPSDQPPDAPQPVPDMPPPAGQEPPHHEQAEPPAQKPRPAAESAPPVGPEALDSPQADAGGGADKPPDTPSERPGRADSEPNRPPTTANDVKWETLHHGTVEHVDPPKPSGDIITIYRSPLLPARPTTVTAPDGRQFSVNDRDVVQVFPVDETGKVAARPSAVFQTSFDNFGVPDDYRLETPANPLDDQGDAALRDRIAEIRQETDDAPADTGRQTPVLGSLALFANILSSFHSEPPTTMQQVTIGPSQLEAAMIYPTRLGEQIAVLAPSGRLIHGTTHDIVQLIQKTRGGGYAMGAFTILSQLAKKPGYIVW